MISSILIIEIFGFLILALSSFYDLRKREVPDWLSYAFPVIILCISFFGALFSGSYSDLFSRIIGSILFGILGFLIFFFHLWGGADFKLMVGIGSLVGFGVSVYHPAILFLINILLVSALYNLVACLFLIFYSWADFVKSLRFVRSSFSFWLDFFVLGFAIFFQALFLILKFNRSLAIALSLVVWLVPLLYFLFLILRAVELGVLQKSVTPDKLSVGDWIGENVFVHKKLIVSSKSYGVSEEEISLLKRLHLQGAISTVVLRNGIPFVPSFFLTYIFVLLKINLLFNLLLWMLA